MNEGKIERYTSTNAGEKRPIHVFKRVPFAKPLLRGPRFGVPGKAPPWKLSVQQIITYIHGGSFTHDSVVMFNDTQIIQMYASHKTIFVIPVFQLGIFDFLDFGNDDVVKRNIGSYGQPSLTSKSRTQVWMTS
ncbi:hypothetical protein QR680_017942 [Steinernema hermaphroditum]|uniref:Uncharacterized protein n=1 Tax=Steinernema hermaphroditum TaxID=289476 RepID=A0AA39HIR5_9BILA|nr:hypothetical protein QR680_017942 [Steinernema hermaphroditum]